MMVEMWHNRKFLFETVNTSIHPVSMSRRGSVGGLNATTQWKCHPQHSPQDANHSTMLPTVCVCVWLTFQYVWRAFNDYWHSVQTKSHGSLWENEVRFSPSVRLDLCFCQGLWVLMSLSIQEVYGLTSQYENYRCLRNYAWLYITITGLRAKRSAGCHWV